MSRARLKNIWSQLPALGALMLSFGALIGGNARAAQPQFQPPVRHQRRWDDRLPEWTKLLFGLTAKRSTFRSAEDLSRNCAWEIRPRQCI